MLVGLRSLINFYDGLRYSLVPGLNPDKYLEREGINDHEVKFNISFSPASYVTVGTVTGTPVLGYASLYIDYVYLDTDERRQFAQVQHEYLIEQLQFTGGESVTATSYKSKLALNHPVKELVWVIQLDANVLSGANRWSDYTNSGTNSSEYYIGGDVLVDAKLQLNGQDRFSVRSAPYFNVVQPYQHHTRCPATGIYVYSFALNPEQHQPSGSVNMSRIDNATLLLNLNTAASSQLRVYAVNYNVLRIMAGIKLYYTNLCQTVSCMISSAITYYEKQCKLAGAQMTSI